ncbi:MAG: hypothetical protein ACTSVI_12220 [Promethearchaeota archaeon]
MSTNGSSRCKFRNIKNIKKQSNNTPVRKKNHQASGECPTKKELISCDNQFSIVKKLSSPVSFRVHFSKNS